MLMWACWCPGSWTCCARFFFWSARRRSLEQPQDQKGAYHHRRFGRSFRARLCEWSNKQALNLFIALCLWVRMKWMSMTWTALLKFRVVVGRARWHSSPFRLMLILNARPPAPISPWGVSQQENSYVECWCEHVDVLVHGLAVQDFFLICEETQLGTDR